MNKSAILLFSLITLVIAVLAPSSTIESQEGGSALELVEVITLPGDPERIMPLCYGYYCLRINDLVYYDDDGSYLRFLDLVTHELADYKIWLDHFSTDFFMVKNHQNNLIYALSENKVCNDETFNRYCWEEARVNIIGGRNYVDSFSLNELFDGDPPNPTLTPRYDVDGITFKEPLVEDNLGGRLYVHDVIKRNVDIVDISANGTADMDHYRYSYMDPVACYDQPSCSWWTPLGNSLALDYEHETVFPDDLATKDDLYIENGPIYVMRHNQSVGGLSPVELPNVDFMNTFPYGNGTSTMGVGAKDRLYAASGSQSLEEGFIGLVDTTDNTYQEDILLTYGDEGHMVVDHFDMNRVFILTHDGFDSFDPNDRLILSYIYDGVLVEQLTLMNGYDDWSTNDMVFDPSTRRLYVLVNNDVFVIQVNHGAGPVPTPLINFDFKVEQGVSSQNFDLPDNSNTFSFSATSVLADTTVTIQERSAVDETTRGAALANNLRQVRLFEITAEETATGTPLTEFDGDFQWITTRYSDREIAGVKEATLRLYRWSGSQWILLPSSGPDLNDNELWGVVFKQLGLYGLFGESEMTFLPALLK